MADKNKDILNNDKNSEAHNTKKNFSDVYSSDIVKAFADKMEKKNPNFLPTATKQKTIQEFEQFVKDEYDDNILEALKNGKIAGNSIDIELNKIVDKWFTIEDLLSPVKSSVIKNKFGHITSEADAISYGILQCYKQREKNLTTTTKNILKFDDFLREIWYKSTTDQEWNIISVSPWPKWLWKSLANIKNIWNDFVRSNIHNSNDINLFANMMNFDHFDPTEKIACISAVRELNHQIDVISKWNTQKNRILTDVWLDVFSNDALYDPIWANIGWTNIKTLERYMNDFFQKIAVTWVVTKKDIDQLKNIRMTSKSCALIWEKSGDLPKWIYDEQLKNRKFSELSKQMQSMVNAFSQIDLVNNISDTIEQVEVDIDSYAKIFDIPWNMAHFFDQFGLPSAMEIDKNSHEYKLHDAEYKRKNKELYDFIKANKWQFESNSVLQQQKESLEQEVKELQLKINPHWAYLSLKQQKERIRDELSSSIDNQKKQELTKKLSDIDMQINNYKETTQVSTRDQYFDHIENQVDNSLEVVWSWETYGSQVKQTLQKLKSQNRDVSKLSEDEQNILMKASVNIQLMKVKDSDINNTVWYSFQEYASFVSWLYDLRTPSQSIIITQDKEPITLNFTSKKFVGKPLERHNIDVSDISSLKNIRIEFEIDLNNNPDAEEFIRIMTGWDKSQLIEDFLPGNSKNFPKTITDSTLVKMIDKDGNPFEGYLSRYEFPDDENYHERPEWLSPQSENSTYILYSEPADKLSTTREVKTRWSSDKEWKHKPVYINMDNSDDWQSIEVLDKKVTLSDQHLKALTLGHMLAQKTEKNDLLYPKNPSIIQDLIKNNDENYHTQLSKSNRDINKSIEWWEESNTIDENINKSESTLFLSQRNNLLWWWDKSNLCEVWTRLIVKPKEDAVKSIPDWNQFLSATVKDVQKDKDGNITGCTFWFDTLSRTGKCTIKDVTLSGWKLLNMKEVFSSITYLDNVKKDNQDYTATLERLQILYSKDKNYNWNIFSNLNFNGQEFEKWKEKITKFIAPQATIDAHNNSNKKYNIEYTIKKKWDLYEIVSSPYAIDITQWEWKNQKSKKENIIFETVTDMTWLLLILAWKKLTPYTKKEELAIDTDNIDTSTLPTRSSRKRSLSTIFTALKWWWKSIIDGLKKKRWEEQESEVKNLLFNELNVYRKLQWVFWWILWHFDLDVFDDLADEAEAESMDYGWKKIDGYYQHLSKFHPAWNSWVRRFWLWMAHEMMAWAVESYQANQTCSYKDRLKTAWTLMYMLEKMKSWYSKDFAQYPRWIYVQILLWPKAYSVYRERYKELEKRSQINSPEWYKIKEQLTMFEYNFIVDTIRWWSNTDPERVRWQKDSLVSDPKMNWNNPFYYQNLYSRKFANELSKLVWWVKDISADKNSESVKGLIAGNNFDHVYNECRDHISQLRVSDAVGELVALQQIASKPEEWNKVIMLMMAGILNWAFVHHIWKQTKEDLKWVFRNSSIPFPQWIEHYDGAKKIQTMLQLATADMWSNSFLEYTKYDVNDFDPLIENNKNVLWFIGNFEERRKITENRVVPFLHMDPSTLNTDDNLIKIRKSEDPELKIFGHKVDPLAKSCIDEMMWELYLNRSRWANLDNYNYSSGLTHTATTIENFYRDSVNKYKWQDWDPAVWDHAGTIWDNLKENAPNGKEWFWRKDILSHHVNEFFRVFQGMWAIDYDSWQIDTFYRHIRLAQNPSLTAKDRKRLVRFEMTKLLFSRWSVPEVVSDTFIKYMQYFEDNLENFDSTLWKLHLAPWDHNKNFEHSFTSVLDDIKYIPQAERNKLDMNQKNKLYREYEDKEISLLNMSMYQSNKQARWNTRNYNTSNILWISYDKKIEEMTGWIVWWDAIGSANKKQLPIDVTNKDNIDLSSINNKPSISVNKNSNLWENKQNNNDLDELQNKLSQLGINPNDY